MRLTGFANFYITVVIVGVLGYTTWHYQSSAIRKWAGAERSASQATAAVAEGDFAALKNAPPDPTRGIGSTGVTGSSLPGAGKLNRPLVGGINTLAGDSPGLVFNNSPDPHAGSSDRPNHRLEVKVVLVEG